MTRKPTPFHAIIASLRATPGPVSVRALSNTLKIYGDEFANESELRNALSMLVAAGRAAEATLAHKTVPGAPLDAERQILKERAAGRPKRVGDRDLVAALLERQGTTGSTPSAAWLADQLGYAEGRTVSLRLKRMVEDGYLEVVSAGVGSRPTQYAVTEAGLCLHPTQP